MIAAAVQADRLDTGFGLVIAAIVWVVLIFLVARGI